MKKFLLLAWGVIAAFSLNSCSKDDDGKKDDPNDPQPQEMRYVKSILGQSLSRGWREIRTYEYDDKGRRTKMVITYNNNIVTYNYTYNENTVTIQKESIYEGKEPSKETSIVQLDANGYPLSRRSDYDTYVYGYDEDGHLISVKETDNSGFEQTHTYTWFNDNLIDCSSPEPSSYEYNTTPVKLTSVDLNVVLSDELGLEWFDADHLIEKHSVNMLAKYYINGYNDPNSYETFTYQFDEDGYVTKVTTYANGRTMASTFEISYY